MSYFFPLLSAVRVLNEGLLGHLLPDRPLGPSQLPESLLTGTKEAINGEFQELLRALEDVVVNEAAGLRYPHTHADVFDALVDSLYFALGALVRTGRYDLSYALLLDEGLSEHAKNCSFPPSLEESARREGLGVEKYKSFHLTEALEPLFFVQTLEYLAFAAVCALVGMGVDVHRAVLEVHRANMTKVRGHNSQRPSNRVDLVKPPDWVPPNWPMILQVQTRKTQEWVMYVEPRRRDVDFAASEFKKFDSEKRVRLELVPPQFLQELGGLMAAGARKYGEDNWKKCPDPRRYVGAMYRHLLAFLNGESHDDDSSAHHLVAVACNAMMLRELSRGSED